MNRVLNLQATSSLGQIKDQGTSALSAGLCSSISGGLCSAISAGLCALTV